MLVERGNSTYVYNSQRVNGKPVTRYIGKSTSPQAQEYAKGKEAKKQYRNREEELQRLNEQLEHALKLIKIMERGYLLVAGFYERKSEIRKLQEDHYAQ
jgi:exonuclease VII large subunit